MRKLRLSLESLRVESFDTGLGAALADHPAYISGPGCPESYDPRQCPVRGTVDAYAYGSALTHPQGCPCYAPAASRATANSAVQDCREWCC